MAHSLDKAKSNSQHARAKSNRNSMALGTQVSLSSGQSQEYLDENEEDETQIETRRQIRLNKKFYKQYEQSTRYIGMKRSRRLKDSEKGEIQSWIGYGHAAQDWNALLTFDRIQKHGFSRVFPGPLNPKLKSLPAPQRVLDLGCGPTPHWILSAIQDPYWEETLFVGLDSAPILIPNDLLPYNANSRMSFLQHNFIPTLPFKDALFDYVRLSNLALEIPEGRWTDLLEEISRVLTPNGYVEVIEHDAGVLSLKDPDGEAAQREGGPATPASIFRESIHDVLAQRWINMAPFSVIGSAMVINLQNTQIVSRSQLTLPSSRYYASKNQPESENDTNARVYLHAYALLLDGASDIMAAEFTTKQEESRRKNGQEDDLLNPYIQIKSLEHKIKDNRDSIGDWAETLVERADMSSLMQDRFDWRCEMDLALEATLASCIPLLSAQLNEYDSVSENTLKTWSEEERTELSLRRSQAHLAKREAEAEIRAVEKRLGKGAYVAHGWEGKSAVEFQEFVAKALVC